MARIRPISERIAEAKKKLDRLELKKRIRELQEKERNMRRSR